MKNRFTISESNVGYTLGGYMLMKANEKKAEAMLPVAQRSSATKGERAVATIATYVNDKLTIKAPPAKDKIIRTFPLRASASAILSASVACAFILSFCIIGARITGTSVKDTSEPNTASASYSESDTVVFTAANK